MVSGEDVKWLFCSWEGIAKLKKVVNLVCGAGVILCSIFSLLNIFRSAFHPIEVIRHLWNCLFGVLMIMLQLNWTEWITRRFGFLTGWFGRGMFYLFVGTNIMNPDTDAGLVILTFFFGFAVCFVGIVELLFGFKCAPSGADAEAPRAQTDPSAGPSISSGGPSASGEPTFNVTVTPSQAAALAVRGFGPVRQRVQRCVRETATAAVAGRRAAAGPEPHHSPLTTHHSTFTLARRCRAPSWPRRRAPRWRRWPPRRGGSQSTLSSATRT